MDDEGLAFLAALRKLRPFFSAAALTETVHLLQADPSWERFLTTLWDRQASSAAANPLQWLPVIQTFPLSGVGVVSLQADEDTASHSLRVVPTEETAFEAFADLYDLTPEAALLGLVFLYRGSEAVAEDFPVMNDDGTPSRSFCFHLLDLVLAWLADFRGYMDPEDLAQLKEMFLTTLTTAA